MKQTENCGMGRLFRGLHDASTVLHSGLSSEALSIECPYPATPVPITSNLWAESLLLGFSPGLPSDLRTTPLGPIGPNLIIRLLGAPCLT